MDQNILPDELIEQNTLEPAIAAPVLDIQQNSNDTEDR